MTYYTHPLNVGPLYKPPLIFAILLHKFHVYAHARSMIILDKKK